jgi:hypothetical protein
MRFSALVCLVLAGVLRADTIDDIVRFHIAAMGGEERVTALEAIHATGTVRASGHDLPFDMIAQRPNRVRITTRAENHSLLQGWNGVDAPWRWVQGKTAAPEPMPSDEARAFKPDAEYDDPLVAGRARGYTLDYAGEITWRGKRAYRVLVTRGGDEPASLVVDHETYFILARLSTHTNVTGQESTVVTRFSDFQPVDGVILPFHIEVVAEDKVIQETILREITPVAKVPADAFSPLAALAGASQKE